MTRQRDDDKSTPFGLWTRGQMKGQKTDVQCIDSQNTQYSVGYDSENLDYIWFQYKGDKIMLLEEKRYKSKQTPWQRETHSIVDQALKFTCDSGHLFNRLRRQPRTMKYCGYHTITFEYTNPEDGWTKIDEERVTIDQLLEFLQFKWMPTQQEVDPTF